MVQPVAEVMFCALCIRFGSRCPFSRLSSRQLRGQAAAQMLPVFKHDPALRAHERSIMQRIRDYRGWKTKLDELKSQRLGKKRRKIEDSDLRNQCRISCGADIVIEHVLNYLVLKNGQIITTVWLQQTILLVFVWVVWKIGQIITMH